MKIVNLRVIPNAKRDLITQEDGRIKIHVKSPAIDGRANERAIELLGNYYNVKKKCIRIVRGLKSREKTVEIRFDEVR